MVYEYSLSCSQEIMSAETKRKLYMKHYVVRVKKFVACVQMK